jgi:hypothetical protein
MSRYPNYAQYNSAPLNDPRYQGPQTGGPMNYNNYQKLASNQEFNKQALECNSFSSRYTKVRPSFKDDSINLLDHETFSNNITDPRTLSKEVIEYEEIRRYCHVASKDRDRSLYPSPANFKIELPECFCDVYRISIAGGTLPNLDNIDADPFVYLDVPELNHIQTTSMDKYFGVLSLHSGNTSSFFNLDKSSTNLMPLIFNPIRRELHQLHIKLFHPNGTAVNFGTQTELDVLDFTKQATFVFEIVERRKKRVGLDSDHRNVAGIQ